MDTKALEAQSAPGNTVACNELSVRSPHAVLEETGTAFDPSTQHLDLSKEEKRRTTALLMAIQTYSHLIIKDAEMYVAISRDQGRGDEAVKIRPATISAMVEAAIEFDFFIKGGYDSPTNEDSKETEDGHEST